MKMHITVQDLAQLDETQKRSLNTLWKPQRYDVAVAYICTDAENETYEEYEFVVGNITLDDYAHVFLCDLKAPENISDEDAQEEPETDEDEAEPLEDFRPAFFNKEECSPLFNIGQMIEILSRSNFGEGDFYLTASNGEIGCEIGKNAASWEAYGQGYETKELCDVLWELIKGTL